MRTISSRLNVLADACCSVESRLWRQVAHLGGHEQVTVCKLWRQVGETFRPPKTCTTVSWSFRIFYEKALLEYEKHKVLTGQLQIPLSAIPQPGGTDREKDCFEIYALVPGLLREEVHVQSDPAGRPVITGDPEQPDNPWGITPFKKPHTSGSAVGVENSDDTLNRIARGMFGGYVNASVSADGNYSSPLDDDLALF